MEDLEDVASATIFGDLLWQIIPNCTSCMGILLSLMHYENMTK
jgi:hypothetical protein